MEITKCHIYQQLELIFTDFLVFYTTQLKSKYMYITVPDGGYSRSSLCALNLISTFKCYERTS